jgi:uridine kinase
VVADVLDEVRARVARLAKPRALIGIDGPDGAGKTIFADRLASALRALGPQVIRISADDFHQQAALRYARGRDSPEGFWLDSYDYPRLRGDVLTPLGPGGNGRYRTAAHDLASDEVLTPPTLTAREPSITVVDGLFLHRDELAGSWDLSVYLDVPYAVTARRMADRDGTHADPDHPSMRRYVEAQRIYQRTCAPGGRASVVIDNSDFRAPKLVRSS